MANADEVREVGEAQPVPTPKHIVALVGVYSDVKSHIVMFDFLCGFLGGEPTASAESPEVAWVEREAALDRIIRPPVRDRMRDMLEFSGPVVYRSYTFDANEVHTEYTVHSSS